MPREIISVKKISSWIYFSALVNSGWIGFGSQVALADVFERIAPDTSRCSVLVQYLKSFVCI